MTFFGAALCGALLGAAAAQTSTSTGAAPASQEDSAPLEQAPDRSAFEAELFGAPAEAPPASEPSSDVASWASDPTAPTDRSELEAEMFGHTRPARTSTAPRTPAALGESPRSSRLLDQLTDRLTTSLQAREDLLTLGGRLLLQLQMTGVDGADFGNYPIRSPSFVDVYLDARPSDRIRFFGQGRVQSDFTIRDQSVADGSLVAFQGLAGFVPEETVALLDQLWLKFDLWRTVYVTAGKQPVRWGSGRVFNPTDFLNRQRLNPVAIVDQRLGLGLLKFHLPLERLGWNLYAIVDLEDADLVQRIGGLLRAEILIEQAELALTAASQRELGERIGIDLSVGVWLLELRSEVALTTGAETPFFEGDFDLNTLTFPDEVDRSDAWFIEAMFGFDLTLKLSSDGDQLILGGEYYYNESGYPDSSLLPYFGFSSVAAGLVDDLGLLASQIPEAATAGAQVPLNPFRYGRHYAAAFATLIGPWNLDDTTVLLTGITNLSDRSGLIRLDFSQTVLTFIGFRLFGQAYVGETGGIFKFAVPPFLDEDGPASPILGLVPGLDALLTTGIPGPLFDVGFAFTLSF